MKKSLVLGLLPFFFFLQIAEAAPAKRQPVVKIGKQTIAVEVARTNEEWRKGLMFRERLAPKTGMLFFGTTARMQSFWMKNTPLSLDMIFIGINPDQGKHRKKNQLEVLHIAPKTEPLSETPISSRRPAIHVLEIGGGECDRLKIQVGDPVDFSGIPPSSSH